jgi:hypothetical protein
VPGFGVTSARVVSDSTVTAKGSASFDVHGIFT